MANEWTKKKITDERKELFLRAYALNVRVKEACEISGVSRATFNSWLGKDPVFAEHFRTVMSGMLASLESVVFESALDGNVEDAKWLLTKRMPNTYGNKPMPPAEVTVRFAGASSTDEVRLNMLRQLLPELQACEDWAESKADIMRLLGVEDGIKTIEGSRIRDPEESGSDGSEMGSEDRGE